MSRIATRVIIFPVYNLQEHNVVGVIVKRLRDVPGVKLTCIRGKYDLAHVVKKTAP